MASHHAHFTYKADIYPFFSWDSSYHYDTILILNLTRLNPKHEVVANDQAIPTQEVDTVFDLYQDNTVYIVHSYLYNTALTVYLGL